MPTAESTLPGLNCGLCGFPRCEELAARLHSEPEMLKRCIPLQGGHSAPMPVPEAQAASAARASGVALPTYSYDSNGNLASGAGRTVSWTSFNKVASITRGTTQLSYLHDAEHDCFQ